MPDLGQCYDCGADQGRPHRRAICRQAAALERIADALEGRQEPDVADLVDAVRALTVEIRLK